MPSISFQEEVQTFQIDFSRHVNNSVYIQWLEKARVKLCAAAGYPVEKMIEFGFLPVLTNTEITYKKPLFMGEIAQIEVWVSEVGGASAWMEYRITNAIGEICAIAKQRGLWVDSITQKPRRIDAIMRDKFAEFMKDDSQVPIETGDSEI